MESSPPPFSASPGETPPLPPAPPPMRQPPPRPPRSRGRFWLVVAIILAGFLGISVLINVQQFLMAVLGGASATASGPRMEEVLIEQHHARHKICVVDLTGMIIGDAWDGAGYGMVQHIRRQLRRAGEDRAVRAVILRVDSPGGEVMASDTISQAVLEFQQDYGKPVIAAFGGVAASGGYYAAAPSRWIVASDLTLTGSIGVLLHTYNYRGLMDKVGVQPVVFKSGRFKDMLSGDKDPAEVLPEEREMVQALIDETFTRFKDVVRDGRARAHDLNLAGGDAGRALAANWEEFADGRVLSGRQAYDLGFVDELGDFDAAFNRAKQLAGLDEANLVRYVRPFGLGDFFRILGRAEKTQVTLDLGLDRPPLKAGRLYFLSPTLVY